MNLIKEFKYKDHGYRSSQFVIKLLKENIIVLDEKDAERLIHAIEELI